jgi:hypothetical protein
MRRGSFANLFCTRRGYPIKKHNRRTLQCQMQCEGGNAKNNPFNTTQKMPNSTDYNHIEPGVAVQNYTTTLEGLEALDKTFDDNPDFAGIDHALRVNLPARQSIGLIGRSPWGTAPKLLVEVLSWIARVPGVLALLERKQIAS